jgi:uncharacterized protein YegP (UPF0339 family)
VLCNVHHVATPPMSFSPVFRKVAGFFYSMTTNPSFHIYIDRKHEWRWRLVARNSKIIADSGEGYSRKHDAVRAANRLKYLSVNAPVETQ